MVLPPVSTLFAESWSQYKRQGKLLVLIQVCMMLMMALTVILSVILFSLFGVFTIDITTPAGTILLFLGIVACITGVIVVQSWTQATLFCAVCETHPRQTVSKAFKRGWAKAKAFFWINLLMCGAILGGFTLFIIPGFVVMVWVFASQFIMIEEGRFGIAAINKSKAYVDRAFWAVAGRMVLGGIVYLAFDILVAQLIKQTGNMWANNLASIAISIFVSPLVVIYGYRMYKAIK